MEFHMSIDIFQLATEIVRERYNVPATIRAITRLNAFVLRLRFADRPARILKLAKSNSSFPIQKELAIIETLRRLGIPVPEVEFVDLQAQLPYAIFLSAGETTVLDHLVEPAAGESLVAEMGSLLARIHGLQPG